MLNRPHKEEKRGKKIQKKKQFSNQQILYNISRIETIQKKNITQ